MFFVFFSFFVCLFVCGLFVFFVFFVFLPFYGPQGYILRYWGASLGWWKSKESEWGEHRDDSPEFGHGTVIKGRYPGAAPGVLPSSWGAPHSPGDFPQAVPF